MAYKYETINIIALVLIFCGFIGTVIFGALNSFVEGESTSKYVKCYDSQRNEIVGLECKEIVHKEKYIIPLVISFIVTFFGLALRVFNEGGLD